MTHDNLQRKSRKLPGAVRTKYGWQWGTWRIEPVLSGDWFAIDDSAGIDDNSPWPRRAFLSDNLRGLVILLHGEGPDPLDEAGIAALQAELNAQVEARIREAKR